MSNPTELALEVEVRALRTGIELTRILNQHLSPHVLAEQVYEAVHAALRAERKLALEEAERACREYAYGISSSMSYARIAAHECTDRIAGLERSE